MMKSSDPVTDLEGTEDEEYGIVSGYISGDMVFTPNWWGSQANLGEFHISGTGFAPNVWVETKQYYYAGAVRLAVRDQHGELTWLLADHLGSTSVALDEDGNLGGQQLYDAWGSVRFVDGDIGTEYTYTGQRSYQDQFGLSYYVARWYDPHLSRFSQPDSLIPDPHYSQSYDRYAYVYNNPEFAT